MIGFPLDNTGYEARSLGAWLGTRTRGVFAADSHYAVTANGDMSVTLSPGLAWLKADTLWGMVALEQNPTRMALGVADGSLMRWAAICLRLDKNLNEVAPVVTYGSYGTNVALSSIPPPEQGGADRDEIYVAAVKIRAGATSILPSDITDLRLNESYCGIMRDGVTGIPTQELHDSWRDWFDGLRTASNAEFRAWFDNLQNQLSDNQLTNLQSQITKHDQKLARVEPLLPDAFPLTIGATSWTTTGSGATAVKTTVITDPKILSRDVMNVDVDVAATATTAQTNAWRDAPICPTAQTVGSVTLRVYGVAPTVDIPVIVKLTRYGSAT